MCDHVNSTTGTVVVIGRLLIQGWIKRVVQRTKKTIKRVSKLLQYDDGNGGVSTEYVYEISKGVVPWYT